ncbi:MAG: NTP transferase domain-containing protein [Muribaculaceae bacterium]|nr:NTP transferase domain-containing protein [Muribaculaceae bacterium]
MKYVILAAGLGSRFAKEGEQNPKPLVNIMGRPMIGRLIDVLMSCGGEEIYIVANSRMPQLVEYLERLKAEKGLPLVVRPIVSDNSYYSLSEACRGVTGRFIAMTVDAIFPINEFRSYVSAVEAMPQGEVLMGLTRFVDDESPLYAHIGADDTVIDYRYGGEPFGTDVIVSAGLYGLTDEAMAVVARREGYPESLSDFQRILAAETDIQVRPYLFTKALDVDCGHDREVAEAFLREVNGEDYCSGEGKSRYV